MLLAKTLRAFITILSTKQIESCEALLKAVSYRYDTGTLQRRVEVQYSYSYTVGCKLAMHIVQVSRR